MFAHWYTKSSIKLISFEARRASDSMMAPTEIYSFSLVGAGAFASVALPGDSVKLQIFSGVV